MQPRPAIRQEFAQIGRGRRLLADRDEAASRGGFHELVSLSQRDAEHRSGRVGGCGGRRDGRTRRGGGRDEALEVQRGRASPFTI